MKKYRTVVVPEHNINESYTCCDYCNGSWDEYGHSWFDLKYTYGEFKDECGETLELNFCCFECLKNYLKKNKPVDTAHPQFELNPDWEEHEATFKAMQIKINELKKENKKLQLDNDTLKSAINLVEKK